MGILFTYQTLRPQYFNNPQFVINIGLAFFSISVALNVLLTLMISIRLILHSRNFRNAVGTPGGASGLYKTIVTVLIESCALYALSFLLFIGPWGADSGIQYVFFPILIETQVCCFDVFRLYHNLGIFASNHSNIQVIAPFLIVLRVAKQRALTSETLISGNIGTLRFGGQGESTGCEGTLPTGNTLTSMDVNGETSRGRGVEIENIIDEVSR